MTGLILVVDDVPANVKLLEAKLTNEYYDVVTARDGFEAIEKTIQHKPDLILLDVMMPGMDGFETCQKLKENPDVAHIPVVMVTALSEVSDRVQGLESGADDFITKPINDMALFARVKSLIRIKVLIDELRLRDQSGAQMGIISEIAGGGSDVTDAHIVIIDDDAVQAKHIKDHLLERQYTVEVYGAHELALEYCKKHDIDLMIISTMLTDIDGLRLATQFKAIDTLRHLPIVMLVDEDDQALMLKALELGVNDYLLTPIEYNEMLARVKTQLRRKKFQDALKSNYKESVSMAITDGLTKLYNRHYLDTHLKNMVESSLASAKNMSVVMMDMDHFKSVNDTYGHDVGDEVLIQLSGLIVQSIRSSDLAARYGGEEFVVLMPDTDFKNAWDVADRIRQTIQNTPFKVSHEIGVLNKTISIGLASLNLEYDTPEMLLKRADNALYEAKNGGRNQVCPKPGETQAPVPAQPAPPASVAPVANQPTPQPTQALPVASAPIHQPATAAPPPPPINDGLARGPIQSASQRQPAQPQQPDAQPGGFDPNLAERINEVRNVGQSPNTVQLDDRQKQALKEISLLKPKPAASSGGGGGDNSPIDDEPPGTF